MGKIGEVESVKAVSDLFSPVNGEVIEVNQSLLDHPEIANDDPFGAGWILRITINDVTEIDSLMSAEDYDTYISGLS